MPINSIGPSHLLQIDQNKNIYHLVCENGNISAGSNFEDILSAKFILENGQNVHSVEAPKEGTQAGKIYSFLV